jgi:hypothetical protein
VVSCPSFSISKRCASEKKAYRIPFCDPLDDGLAEIIRPPLLATRHGLHRFHLLLPGSKVGSDVKHVAAVGQEGHQYSMDVAVGDKVRLFSTAKV